jgi:hypothetical protein
MQRFVTAVRAACITYRSPLAIAMSVPPPAIAGCVTSFDA